MRRTIGTLCLVGLLILCGLVNGQTTRPPQLGKDDVKQVIASMTLEEKARLLVGMGSELPIPGLTWIDPEDKKVPEKVPGAAGRTHAIPRLGIPSIILADGPAGVRINATRENAKKTFHATAFPVATLIASSWDPALARKVGEAFGAETREYGIDILLAPGMNIHRNPLGGRNFEYYSEDPLITGKMAAAFVTGVQSEGVGTAIKHFAVNSQEFNRMQSDSIVSERALREIYLRAFEIAVKEGRPWTVMSSYNLVNGTYTPQSRDLLTTILRDEWGFSGFVMTDWWAGNNAVEMMSAGNDMIMPGMPGDAKAIIDAVRSGNLSQQQLDQNVERVLNIITSSPSFKRYKYSDQPDLKANATIARDAAAAGMVLLKNNGSALPLISPKKIALYGNASYELIVGGSGSGSVNKAYTVSLAQGLSGAGFAVDSSLKQTYERYLAEQLVKHPRPKNWYELVTPLPEMPADATSIKQTAGDADVAVITIGRNAGEGGDRKVEGDFTLSEVEQTLIKTVSDVFHEKGKKVVVVMNVGGVTEVVSWRDRPDAILLAWQPGQEGGNAIADVLSGKVNPSGRLATTFPARYEDVPSAKSFPGKELTGRQRLSIIPFAGRPAEAIYEEGIYVGYRYFDTFGVKPAYSFGHGLSYTTFSYGDLKLSSKQFKGKLKATIAVTNTGTVAGREVVQLYVSAPKVKLAKPAFELKGFAKTELLRPGQTQTVTFELSTADLASFDSSVSSWIADAGTYTVRVGSSSSDIKKTDAFQVKQEMLVEKVHKALPPKVNIQELRPGR